MKNPPRLPPPSSFLAFHGDSIILASEVKTLLISGDVLFQMLDKVSRTCLINRM